MKNILKEIYRKIISFLPTKIVINLDMLRGYHKLCNLKNPKYFGEKIQWLKLYGNLEKYKDYVDKYSVRKYIEEKVGKEYLIPLLGIYDSPKEIKYDELPNQMVIKLNTGSGFNIIVDDKHTIDKKAMLMKLERWMKIDYSAIKKEPQYKNIQKKYLLKNI